MFPRLPHHRR